MHRFLLCPQLVPGKWGRGDVLSIQRILLSVAALLVCTEVVGYSHGAGFWLRPLSPPLSTGHSAVHHFGDSIWIVLDLTPLLVFTA